jgi:hypothetical protein
MSNSMVFFVGHQRDAGIFGENRGGRIPHRR